VIDTQAIRSKILDLAMRGKLTEQLPEDGTAEELYRQIQAEKQALIKAGKIKKEKPLPEISADEIPFETPKSWKWVRLSDIATTNIGLTYHPEDIAEDGTIVVRSSNIINSKMDYADLVKVRCPIRQNEYLNNNDIVICARNGSKALVGKCAIYEGKSGKVAFGAFMAVLRTPFYRYVFCYLHTNAFRRYFHSDDSKQINQVTQNILKEALIPLPPLAEQHRIVARIEQDFSALDTIDALRAKYADNLAVLKSKLIDAAIRGKLTDQLPEDGTAEELYRQIQAEKQALVKAGKIKKEKPLPEITADEIPFEIPKSWKWARLGNLMLDVSTGPFGSMLHESDYCEGGIPLVNPMHIQNGAIHPSDKMRVSPSTLERLSQYRLSEGMIVVARRGDLGRCARIGKSENGWICGTGCFFLNPSRHVFSPFITLVISSPFARSVFRGTAIGTTMANLNHNLLKGLPFPLPPLAEQKRIVERINELLAVYGEFE